jgi:uncharacterized protein (DUF427 family)
MAKAMWNGAVLAESDRFEIVEGNVYFPPDTVNRAFLGDTRRTPSAAGRAPPATTTWWWMVR